MMGPDGDYDGAGASRVMASLAEPYYVPEPHVERFDSADLDAIAQRHHQRGYDRGRQDQVQLSNQRLAEMRRDCDAQVKAGQNAATASALATVLGAIGDVSDPAEELGPKATRADIQEWFEGRLEDVRGRLSRMYEMARKGEMYS